MGGGLMAFEDFERLELRLSTFGTDAQRELHRAMDSSLLLIELQARQNAAFDTGRLAGSITHRITGTGLNLEGRVGPSARYGVVVEFGRRAGARMPPVDALIPWVRRHMGTGIPRRGARRQQALRARAFLVARAIGRRGIRARPFLRPAYQSNRAQIRQIFAGVSVRMIAHLRGRT